MQSKIDWAQVLLQCKQRVAARIHTLIQTSKEPLPDLGKGAGGDSMKPVDLEAEKAIVDVLLQNHISFTLVSEESGVKKFGSKADECYVTTDPIDGTTNLVRGLPFYCSSVAISNGPTLDHVYAGMVADLVHDWTYLSTKNDGAFCNGRRIFTSKTSSLDEAVIGLDLNTYKAKEIAPLLSELIQSTKHIRHYGANALELCYVAEGLTDAFVDIRGKLRATDVAAGFLILKEAGGMVTAPDGSVAVGRLDPKQTLSFVASGNLKIKNAILSKLRNR